MIDAAQQLPLALPGRTAMGREAFFVAEANARALAQIDGWRDWPEGKLALVGPAGAGKSHLAAVWASDTGASVLAAPALPDAGSVEPRAVVVETAEQVAGDAEAERRLLHIHNRVVAAGGRLLLVSRTAPARWPVALPDLSSRLAATQIARIGAPDDALLAAVLVKLFEDRQIAAPPSVVRYCVARMERSFAAAERLVAALDARALATGRPLGQKLAREVLAAETSDDDAG
jgi:chromosomal replication initiation ATPase DnaA